MLAIRTILHPTDFSKHSEYALQLACALARDYGAHLILLHVRETPTMVYGYGEGIVPPEMEELHGELENMPIPDRSLWVTRRVEEGEPVGTILSVASETSTDLIIMGTHGRRGLGRLLMGSVSERVVRRATCPVLTVRTPVREGVAEAVGAGTDSEKYEI